MAEHTKIQWCDHTFNPWIGCTKVATGCKFCYAEHLMDHRYHKVRWGPKGTRVRTKTWDQPRAWERRAAREGRRHKVFCASLADVFEDKPEVQPWRSDLFRLIDQCPHLDWLLLTKRPANIRRMWEGPNRDNVWLGTSVSGQYDTDVCVPTLLWANGLGRHLFLSVEPQIARVDLSRFLFPRPTIHWVIVGGESAQGEEPRPFNLSWARLLVAQCHEATVPCFVKQLGSRPYDGSRPNLKLADGHGGDWDEWPTELRVRQCPESFLPEPAPYAEVR